MTARCACSPGEVLLVWGLEQTQAAALKTRADSHGTPPRPEIPHQQRREGRLGSPIPLQCVLSPRRWQLVGQFLCKSSFVICCLSLKNTLHLAFLESAFFFCCLSSSPFCPSQQAANIVRALELFVKPDVLSGENAYMCAK